MKSIDYLIVGAGIAGLSIADYMDSENQDFILLNQDLSGNASRQSSGVINPITGRRFVKSWNYEEIKINFLKFYRNLESKLNIKFFHEYKMMQELKSPDEENQWLSRTADPEYSAYLDELQTIQIKGFQNLNTSTSALLKSMYLIEVEFLLNQWIKYYEDQFNYRESKFEFNELILNSNACRWRDLDILKGIIFCDGFKVFENPFFNWLPIFQLKGECLKFYSESLQLNSIYKSDYSIVPLGNNQYWCGSNFSLSDSSTMVTFEEKENQINFLKSRIAVPFQIVEHKYGIRPSTRDRRPIIGCHPEDSRLIIFNGLGTKGYSLAPYCAKHLANYLFSKTKIPDLISIERFSRKGFKPI